MPTHMSTNLETSLRLEEQKKEEWLIKVINNWIYLTCTLEHKCEYEYENEIEEVD